MTVARTKVTSEEVLALYDLLSHDPDVLVGTSDEPGLISEAAREHLKALWNRANAAVYRAERPDPPTRRALVAHAAAPCSDPDCEVHHPDVIEDPRERDAATAWFLAGERSVGTTAPPPAGHLVRYEVGDLEAMDLDDLTDAAGGGDVRVTATGTSPHGGSMVAVSAPSRDALVAFVREHWGDDDPQWFQEHVVDRVERIPLSDAEAVDALDAAIEEQTGSHPADPRGDEEAYDLASSDVVVGLTFAEADALLVRAEVAADNPFDDDDLRDNDAATRACAILTAALKKARLSEEWSR